MNVLKLLHGFEFRTFNVVTKLQLTPSQNKQVIDDTYTPKSVTLTHRSGVPIPHRHQALTQSNQ